MIRRSGRLRPLAAAAVAALVLPLAGCGGDPIEEYCSAVEGHRKELAEMVSSDAGPGALLEHLPMLRELAEKSPSDLSDEWTTFLNAVENLDEALDDADVDPGDFRDGKPPAGTSAADAKAIEGAADQAATPEVADAAAAIEQQARDVCKVNFGV